jgi:uncharacterized peroxidase-related enzyme
MSYLKESGQNDQQQGLLEIFKRFPDTCRPLIEFHEALLRNEQSPFSVAQRELIAAYVSGLNACRYCHGIHTQVAQRFGVSHDLLEQLLEDIEFAQIEASMKPVLQFVKKLTEQPARIVNADAEAIFAEGWDDQALYDAVMTCALFNLMNRLVEGLGIEADDENMSFSAEQINKGGYARILKLMNSDEA